MRKPERELLRTIASLGLGIETKSINSTGTMTLILRAENGVTKRFVVTVGSGDTRTELNIRQSFKKFAKENSLPKPAKGLPGPLQAALASAVGKVSQQINDMPKALATLGRPVAAQCRYCARYCSTGHFSPFLPPVCECGHDDWTTEFDPPGPMSKWYTPGSPAKYFPTPKKEAPTMASIEPTTSAAPEAEPRRKIIRNVLSHAQMYALCEAVKARTLVQEDTYTSLAEGFTSTLGFKVSPSSVSSAFAVVGKELLPAKGVARRDRAQIVAAELIRVQESLGMEVTAELRAVAGRQSL